MTNNTLLSYERKWNVIHIDDMNRTFDRTWLVSFFHSSTSLKCVRNKRQWITFPCWSSRTTSRSIHRQHTTDKKEEQMLLFSSSVSSSSSCSSSSSIFFPSFSTWLPVYGRFPSSNPSISSSFSFAKFDRSQSMYRWFDKRANRMSSYLFMLRSS
jgi:hypothetical protein